MPREKIDKAAAMALETMRSEISTQGIFGCVTISLYDGKEPF